jgi:hypothetical protein
MSVSVNLNSITKSKNESAPPSTGSSSLVHDVSLVSQILSKFR